jgi:hypothetical protein
VAISIAYFVFTPICICSSIALINLEKYVVRVTYVL